ncbi:MAG TPA: glucan biosynthesis protein, partial [Spirochaetales bacterium]|nr:glucan biosynthesis protein [Spirochaetales bacterium]
MKRFIALSLILALAAGGAFAQTLDGFQTAFSGFADDMAATLSMNSTIGTTWSDAYIGGFPHFGAGIFLGTTFAGKDGTAALFSAIGQPVPAELEALGYDNYRDIRFRPDRAIWRAEGRPFDLMFFHRAQS